MVANQNKQIVNQKMIKQGMASHLKKHSSDPLYAQLELKARNNKVGRWHDAQPVVPWDWRKPKKRLFQRK